DKDCELLCPVCFELIDEAYVTRCGHSFCYACIAKSVEQHRWGLGTGDWGHRLSISITNRCGAAVATREHMFPNFMLNELVARRRLRAARPPAPPDGGGDRLRSLLAAESRHLAMPDVELMLEVLTRRKRLLEAESAAAHQRLLYEFLAQLHRHRTQQLAQLAREAALVQADMQTVAGALTELRAGAAGLATFPEDAPAGATADAVHALRKELTELAGSVSDSAAPAPDDEGFAGGSGGGTRSPTGGGAWWRTSRTSCSATSRTAPTTCTSRRRPPPAPDAPATPAPPPRPPGPQDDHVPDNEPSTTTKPPCNGDQRLPEGAGVEPPPAPPGPPPGGGAGGAGGLDAFREDLVSFTRYRALRPLATLSYSSDAINYSTIVSTIVTKRIKVFEYEAVVRDAVDVHYPCAEMQCAHKISCVSWNAYHKNVLASADYEGTVAVWDAGTGQRTRALLEHDKRCWSVHFNRADVRLLASGSDDARVKLWALNADRSVATLEARFNVCCVRFNPRSSCHLAFGSAAHCNNSVSVATLEARFNVCCVRFNPRSSCHLAFGSAAHCNNSVSVATLEARFNVCCVRFNPRSSCHLAFGSADHCVHYYDLRAPRQPLAVFRDHRCGAWSRRAACAPSPDTPTRRTSWDSPRRPAAGGFTRKYLGFFSMSDKDPPDKGGSLSFITNEGMSSQDSYDGSFLPLTQASQMQIGDVQSANRKRSAMLDGGIVSISESPKKIQSPGDSIQKCDRNYGPPVDMWGAGCIMAEMWTRSPIMQERLKPYVKDPYGCDLLDKLLQLDPAKRYDADTALNHDFFWTDPMPCELANMLAQHTQSMFEYLAPPRRPGHLRHHHHVAGAAPKPPPAVQDSGYQDRSAPNIQAEKNADTNKTDVHEKDEQEGKSNETTDKTTTDKEGTIEKDSEKTKGTEDITDPKLVETQAGVCVKENGINVEM
ncbi:hypothetical protein MSG28_014400, partial [Choristoneura fumiferana]